MKKYLLTPLVGATCLALMSLSIECRGQSRGAQIQRKMSFEIQLSEKEWRKQLSRKAYHVLREKGTEASGTGEYLNNKASGTYLCRGCRLPLFSSETKFNSRTGWPSFYTPIKQSIIRERDTKFGMIREEVLCRRCGSHLGHVFNDGPPPTSLRYCVNSISLEFKPNSH